MVNVARALRKLFGGCGQHIRQAAAARLAGLGFRSGGFVLGLALDQKGATPFDSDQRATVSKEFTSTARAGHWVGGFHRGRACLGQSHTDAGGGQSKTGIVMRLTQA